MATQVKIGIIGTGRIGQIHARNLCAWIPSATVVAATDAVAECAYRCAHECGIENVVSNYNDIVAAPDIDAVVICSPTNTHADLIIQAARAGKHIFCEKPIALDLASIDRVLAEVEKAGVKLQVGFNRRFDPGFSHARKAVVQGKIGVPHLLRITSRDPEPPPVNYIKSSGGLFMDMTIHDFDMSRFILGEEISEIFAVGNALIDPAIKAAGDIDTAVITMTYRSGAYAVIDNSRKAVYGYDQRLEVFGSEGCIVVGNRSPHEGTLYLRKTTESAKPLYFFLERYQDSFLEEMRQFVLAIENDTQPAVTGIDAKIPVVMGLAAWQSLQEHRPVRIESLV
jgi:myo-inositol 2-dehydrogenase/D-chiro-inositol 1-dehydrogenase